MKRTTACLLISAALLSGCSEGEDDDGGWVPLGRVGQRLAELASDFDPRTYGQAKLSDLVDKAGAFESRRTESGHVQIRLKHVPAKSKK